jgi:hypothetical protein
MSDDERSQAQDKPVVLTVNHRFMRGNGEGKIITDTSEHLEMKKFETTPAIVRRSYGMTLNLGNYESARIDVSVQVPCYVEDIHLADQWAADFCEARVTKEVGRVKGGGGSKKGAPI